MEVERKPVFSVITVCYNATNSIAETLLSTFGQTYEKYQQVIIDGGSTDGTLQVIAPFRNQIDVLISEKDSGIYDAMNKGVRVATGDFLVFMNAGDTFADKDVLAKVAEHISGKKVYYGNSIRVSPDGVRTVCRERTGIMRITRRNICHQAIFYPREALENHPFDLKYRILADWVLNISLFKKYPFKHISESVCCFSLDGISSSNDRQKDPAFIADLPAIIKSNLGAIPFVYWWLRFRIRDIYVRFSYNHTGI